MVLSRDSIKNGLVQKMMDEGRRQGLIEPWSDEQRLQSRVETLARNPGGDVWVFAYGSLMWNPAFHYERSVTCRLYGYHRAFCLWTPLGRGTPDNPGLILGLERGGSCNGMAFKLHADKVEEELDVVWTREMPTGSYHPTWVKLTTPEGPVNAIAFVINPDQPRYACRISVDTAASSIATACGFLGSSAEYLENTVAALDQLGVRDRKLHEILERVREIQAAQTKEASHA